MKDTGLTRYRFRWALLRSGQASTLANHEDTRAPLTLTATTNHQQQSKTANQVPS